MRTIRVNRRFAITTHLQRSRRNESSHGRRRGSANGVGSLESLTAEATWFPLRMRRPGTARIIDGHRVRLRAGMENEEEGTANLGADTGHRHRPPLWNHGGPAGAHHD